MYKYEIILYWSDEDNSYIAEVPELAGCMADGSTMQSALENVHIVMNEWIETAKLLGREIPKPKGKLAFA
ncbi:MAG: type II toxin-antitoxin system HicB family antitoxin [Ruminococcus sp.]|nr:type II toxin-antitoxin system HicB family antitoxin [Ruminococcus sp.]